MLSMIRCIIIIYFTKTLLYLSIFFAISHQIYVVICWRYELFYKGLSKFFAKNAFKVYKIGFIILILLRPILIIIFIASLKSLFKPLEPKERHLKSWKGSFTAPQSLGYSSKPLHFKAYKPNAFRKSMKMAF